MAKEKKNKEKDNDEEKETEVSPEAQMAGLLQDHKKNHYNFVKETNYKVSFGSLRLDKELGGLIPGVIRLAGRAEAGKTSETLEIIDNHLRVPNRRACLFKAEGRLSKEMIERTPVTFVWNAEEWKDQTCFVIETNNYNLTIDTMRRLVHNNPTGTQYLFAVDSMDALECEKDEERGAEETAMVGGNPTVTGLLLKKMNLAFIKLGHIGVFISQYRSSGPTPKGAAPVKKTANASGGYALEHYPNFVLEFLSPRKGDLITRNGGDADLVTNPFVGRWARVKVWKSPNEKTDYILSYPIKYGRKKASSVWREKEVADCLIEMDYFTRKGAWFYWKQELELIKNLFAKFTNIEEKYNGEGKLHDFLEERPEVTEFLFDYFKNAFDTSI